MTDKERLKKIREKLQGVIDQIDEGWSPDDWRWSDFRAVYELAGGGSSEVDKEKEDKKVEATVDTGQ